MNKDLFQYFGVKPCAVFSAILFTGIALAQTPWPQDTKNPSLVIETIPMPDTYMTMGLGFLSDGRLVVAATGEKGGGEVPGASADSKVMIVSGLTGTMSALSVKTVADMWKQPAGVTIVEDKVYISDRDAFYQITNIINPSALSANRTKIIDWPTPDVGFAWNSGTQWHQWVHTPVYFNKKFYGPYGGTIQIGGRSAAPPTSSYSGAFISWNPDGNGGLTKIAGGFRVPNGMDLTPAGQFFVTDNQGSWLPACTFSMVKTNKFYGHRQTSPNKPNWAEGLEYEPPTMWLVDGVHQSVSQPLYMTKGPYAGDFIVGDDNSPGLSRIGLDKVSDGVYNGAMFFLTGGFSNAGQGAPGINRLAMHPLEESMVVGTFLQGGDWPAGNPRPMFRVKFSPTNTTFEMREIHSRQGGVELVFSQPIDAATAIAGNFTLSQWHYTRTFEYGGGATYGMDGKSTPSIASIQISEDKKRVYLALNGGDAAIDRVLKFGVSGLKSGTGASLFHNTAYFSHNFQSSAAFKPTTVGIAQQVTSFNANAMDLAIGYSMTPALLRVKVDLAGSFTVKVHGMDGVLIQKTQGFGPSEFNFPGKSGMPAMHVLQVIQKGQSYARTVFF